ncbi:YbhB/YbcL family Raf kinase inhibitor-like protein [Prosthecomicrobium sp. N25]|uniref:YbhB/YbcL family Raf kinase inhibitor-like protein n=1 Tax=Prosthecomicrobium sp. N25 TaxID=3129254 RepID=UPI00307807F8
MFEALPIRSAALAGAMVLAGVEARAQGTGPFTVTSTKLKDGQPIDPRYAGPTTAQAACGGENVSLPLDWANPPANTKSFAVVVFDFEGGRGPGVVHWIAYGIAPETTSLAEGAGNTPSSDWVGGSSSRQLPTYFGGCGPATDAPHHYIYSVYALDVAKDELPAGLTRDQFLEKVKGKVLGLSSVIGTYRRPK